MIASTSTQAVDEQTASFLPNSPAPERENKRGESIGLAAEKETTPGGVLPRRNVTRDLARDAVSAKGRQAGVLPEGRGEKRITRRT